MKERHEADDEIYIVNSNSMKSPEFAVLSTNTELRTGEPVPDDAEVKFVSDDSSLGGRLFGKAVARNEYEKGKNTILVVPKGTNLKYT